MKEIPVNFENKGEKILGILTLPDTETDKLVIIVHGMTGNMNGSGGVFIELAKKLVENGFAILRFNFRYTDETLSHYEKMTISSEVSDLKLIIKNMRKKFKKVSLVGDSMGATVSILSYDKKINCLVLWYPAVFWKETSVNRWLFSKKSKEELKKKGYVTGFKKSTGIYYRVGKDFVKERGRINLIPKIKKIVCPTLLIHGDSDTTANLNQSERAIKFLKSKNKELDVIKGMEHAFYDKNRKYKVQNYKDIAVKLTADWLEKWLK